TSERKTSFSYLSLLEKNGGNFPHRTQAIMENNPLPERIPCRELRQPVLLYHKRSLPKHGISSTHCHAVGKDGSFYRSSEHIFTNLSSNGRTRASSSTPDRDMDLEA
ncbi:hypothetical protein TCAL_15395, partial [Tigriopus californicus]